MKKPSPRQRILLLFLALYAISAYTDIKTGLLEGFREKRETPVEGSANLSDSTGSEVLFIPFFIKLY